MRTTAELLRAVGREHEARRVEGAKIDGSNSYSCALTALRHADTALRMSWGTTMTNPRHPLARACEAVALAQAGAIVALAGTVDAALWILQLELRVRILAGTTNLKETKRATRRKVIWRRHNAGKHKSAVRIDEAWREQFGVPLRLESSDSIMMHSDRSEYMMRLPDRGVAFACFGKLDGCDSEWIEVYVTVEHVRVWCFDGSESIAEAWRRIFGEPMPPDQAATLVESGGVTELRFAGDRVAISGPAGAAIEAWVELQ